MYAIPAKSCDPERGESANHKNGGIQEFIYENAKRILVFPKRDSEFKGHDRGIVAEENAEYGARILIGFEHSGSPRCWEKPMRQARNGTLGRVVIGVCRYAGIGSPLPAPASTFVAGGPGGKIVTQIEQPSQIIAARTHGKAMNSRNPRRDGFTVLTVERQTERKLANGHESKGAGSAL